MYLSTSAKRYSKIVSCETFESEKVNLLKRVLGGNLHLYLVCCLFLLTKKCWSSECYPNLNIHIIMMIKVLRLCINTVSPSRGYRPYLYPAQNVLDWPITLIHVENCISWMDTIVHYLRCWEQV